jgi:peptidyl-dipeptidase Dcp
VCLAGRGPKHDKVTVMVESTGSAPELDESNPFAAPSPLPWGFPPFDRIRPEHFLPAFTAAMAQHRREVRDVGACGEPATVVNTLEALERSGRMLQRVSSVFFNLTAANTSAELQAVEAEAAPLLAAHLNEILLDEAVFARITALFDARDDLDLTTEQRRLLERYHADAVRAGAALDAEAKDRLRRLTTELSSLSTAFQTRLLAATTSSALHLTDPSDLAGLSDDAVASAREAAGARDLDGFLLPLGLPTGQPVLASLRRRDIRERLHRASVARGLGGEHDTRAVLVRIAEARAEHARLLGFRHHADYAIDDQTAGSLDAVRSMLDGLVGPAVANARAEATDLEALLVADGEEPPLQPWDWAYYANRLREDRYRIDTAALRDYFSLDSVLADGVFHAAGRLYGLCFERRFDLPVYHPDVQVFDVFGPDGEQQGVLLADWFARDSKRGGAWMSTFTDQAHLLRTRPVVAITLNVPRPGDGETALLTLDEVRTAFHEFGHALHALLSDVRYPRLSGTNVPRDFVEFPSQVNEMWAMRQEVLQRYTRHHVTGRALPADLGERLVEAESYGQGFATTEYLAATLLDLAWHVRTVDDPPITADDVEAFETAALAAADIDLPQVPPRYRSAYFSHVWAGRYSAGYYSYIWSEVLDADMVDWFVQSGGLTRDAGRIFARELLSRGGAVDPLAAFAAVRGRPPRVEPLLRRRGLLEGQRALPSASQDNLHPR